MQANGKQEHGYALLIVLFLIVFIMTVSAVFINGSMGNAKQEIKVDESHLTVMAAEAGTDYMRQALTNEYFNNKGRLNEIALKRINETKKGESVNYSAIYEELNGLLVDFLDKKLKEETKKNQKEFAENYTFRYEKGIVQKGSSNREVIYEGVSEGLSLSNDKISKIEFKLSFPIPDYQSQGNGNGNTYDDLPPDMFNFYPPTITKKKCDSKKKIENDECEITTNSEVDKIGNSIVYIPFSFVAPNGDLDIRNSTVFTNGSIITDNFNQFWESSIIVNGDMVVNGNMNNVRESRLKISGNLVSRKEVSLNKSKFYIAGAYQAAKKLEIMNESLVCIGGNISFVEGVSISKDSKLLYSLDTNRDNPTLINLKNAIGVPSDKLWDKCMLNDDISPVTWDKPKIKEALYIK